MFIVNFFRLLKYSIQGFFRNFWLSFVCITTMIIAFILVDILGGITIISNNMIGSLKNKVDVSVYFKNTVSEDKIVSVRNEFLTLDGVKDVTYISQDEALESFKQKHSKDDILINSINTLSENPIGATLIIKANSIDNYSSIIDHVSSDEYKNLIENTDYTDSRLIVNKMNSLNNSVTKVLVVIGLFFGFISGVTVINTLRITIYSRRKEVEIMRFLGASWSFIKVPFIIEGVFYLLAGWLFSVGIFYGLLIFLKPYINLFFDLYGDNVVNAIMSGSVKLIFAELAIGLVVTIFSSVLSIRKYAKV